MNKLYWIVCEEKSTTLFEGKFQGRTRCAAMKFLKEQIGRKSLSGVIFTITEIPVPLIREIVLQVLAEANLAPLAPAAATDPAPEASNVVPIKHPPVVPKVKTPVKPKTPAPVKPTPAKAKPAPKAKGERDATTAR